MAGSGVALSRHLLRARDLIDRAYADELDVDTLSEHAHVSQGYFNRAFKATFGETPHQYLLSRRMERAKQLLRDTDLPVTEVCLRVGFTSLGSFSAAFRRFVGESPSAYRARPHSDVLVRLPACVVKQFSRPLV